MNLSSQIFHIVYSVFLGQRLRDDEIYTLLGNCLKVPKREIFVTELIILSHPIWIGDLRNEPKNRFL
jgi:hypothetical protein